MAHKTNAALRKMDWQSQGFELDAVALLAVNVHNSIIIYVYSVLLSMSFCIISFILLKNY